MTALRFGKLIGALCFLLSSATAGPVGADSTGIPLVISYSVANSDDSQAISGVEVTAVLLNGGTIKLGTTDESGGILIDRVSLEKKQPVIILFCKEGFFCGALRVEADLALEIDDRRVHLARFAIS
jgi:hypothetical protein